jgi:MFS family permease
MMIQLHWYALPYAYGYMGLAEKAGSATFEIATAYPQLQQWYGLLSGLFYTIPYALFDLVIGKYSDRIRRAFWLGIATIIASVTMGVSGAINSFLVFGVMRMLHGMMAAASNQLSF